MGDSFSGRNGNAPPVTMWSQRVCKLAGDIRSLPYRDVQAFAAVLQTKLQPAITALNAPTGPAVVAESLLAAAEAIPGIKE